MADVEPQDSPVLHVVVVGFHHKKGCQVEYSYPSLVPGNPVDSHEIPSPWKHLPSLALPDGAHNYTKDTIFFHLPALTETQETVYGVSCYRQMDATELLNRGAEVTRNTVQKSVCVLSKLPLYGLIQAKLELITHAYFRERDFSHVDLLEDTYKNLSASLSDSLLQGSQAFLGLPIRDTVQCFKHKIVLLFKLILLERRVLIYGSPVQPICSTLLSLLSLFPGMIEYGLQESSSCSSKRQVSPTLKFTKVTDSSEAFLEVSYSENHSTKPQAQSTSQKKQNRVSTGSSSSVHENNPSSGSTEIPEKPSECNQTESPKVRQERSMSCSSVNSTGRPKPLFERQISTGSIPGTARRTSSIGTSLREDSIGSVGSHGSDEYLSSSPVVPNNSDISIHSRHNSGHLKQKHSPSKENTSPYTDHVVPNIEGITHIETVQKIDETHAEDSVLSTSHDSGRFNPSAYLREITKIKPIQKVSARAERLSSAHDENLSPDEQELLDSDECFSWEEDKLLLEIDEILDTVGTKAQMRRTERHHSGKRDHEHISNKKPDSSMPHGSPGHVSLDDPLHATSKKMSDVDDARYFSDLDLKVHKTVKTHHSPDLVSNLVKSDSKSSLDSVKSTSSGSGIKTGSSLKLKMPRSKKKKVPTATLR